MRYEGITPTGARIALGDPIQAELSMEETVPADSITVTFPGNQTEPLQQLMVYDEDDTLLFGGIVDVQKNIRSAKGSFLRISGRSKAAWLLDTEACPQTLERPSLPLLFEQFGCGLQGYRGDIRRYRWTYVIPKGVSAWQVFADFCLYCMDLLPVVTPDGVLDCTGSRPDGLLVFSQEAGIPYREITEIYAPCRQIRELWTQSAMGEGYTANAVDLAAVEGGVRRVRYLTAANWQGRKLLRQSHRRSQEIVLTCGSEFTGKIGMQAVVQDPQLGTLENYSVAKLIYRLDGSGARWIVTLRTDR